MNENLDTVNSFHSLVIQTIQRLMENLKAIHTKIETIMKLPIPKNINDFTWLVSCNTVYYYSHLLF
jgi:hypothetical protein